MTIDLKKCEECEESRCIMSKYYGLDLEAIEEAKIEAIYQKRLKDDYNAKIKKHYISESKYWTTFKDREVKLVNYDRKPYMNKTDWMHDDNWFIGITKLMELQEEYYSNIKY